MSKPLWTPSIATLQKTVLWQFIQRVNQQYQKNIQEYADLYAWSVNEPTDFWRLFADFSPLKLHQQPSVILTRTPEMLGSTWFVDATLNFAENLLQRHDNKIALYFKNECQQKNTLTFSELYKQVSAIAHYFLELGIKPGDVIAGFLPNIPATVISMLAATSIGAIWTCCATDFGLQAVLDRLEQVKPKVLITVESHSYAGKTHDHLEKIVILKNKLSSLKKVIVVPYLKNTVQSDAINFNQLLKNSTEEIPFITLPFNHPVYILYSSGTTGKPKCIVHGAGGTLLQHYKEHQLHNNLSKQDILFCYTSSGWMMWNWMVSALALGTALVLYDGSPMHPKATQCFDLIDEFKITAFCTSAKYLAACEKNGLSPKKTHTLSQLKILLSTGSTLLKTQFHYVYEQIKSDLQLSSISGGTDIVSCFALGCPILPVYEGELQCRGLGMKVEIFDDHGETLIEKPGELVCTAPFPSMPIYFWDDPKKEKYCQAYFSRFKNIWTHGDYALLTEHGGLVIYGRSDATLNPNGIRIGTAEIYRQVEQFIEIAESLVTSQAWEGSERIILFVKMQPNYSLTDILIEKIKQAIKTNTSPNHVPSKLIELPDIPKTLNGKIVELAVKNILHGRPNQNLGALANPEILTIISTHPMLQV